MSIPKKVKEILESLSFKSGSINEMIKTLILEGSIVEYSTTSEEVVNKLNERFGKVIKASYINVYMKPFQRKGIVIGHTIREGKTKRKIWLGSWIPKEKFISSYKTHGIPFSKELVDALGKKFDIEINDLKLVYGKSGDCTAFILRKILEKAIYLAFAKNNMIDKLRNPSRYPKFYSLEKMLDIASKEKGNDGTPYLTPNTASKLIGVKFLGDTASHNFLENVKMDDIPHQIPFISIALGELSKKF